MLTSSEWSTKGAPEPLRAVLDTNVLISALVYPGPTGRVWDLALEGLFEVFVSPFLLEELRRNLLVKLGFPQARVDALILGVRAVARLVHPPISISVVRRKDSDNRILECAVEAKAHVLVTGNMGDLRVLGSFQGIAILKPREFLDQFFPEDAGSTVGEGAAGLSYAAGLPRSEEWANLPAR